jgi:hypothetical protein
MDPEHESRQGTPSGNGGDPSHREDKGASGDHWYPLAILLYLGVVLIQGMARDAFASGGLVGEVVQVLLLLGLPILLWRILRSGR